MPRKSQTGRHKNTQKMAHVETKIAKDPWIDYSNHFKAHGLISYAQHIFFILKWKKKIHIKSALWFCSTILLPDISVSSVRNYAKSFCCASSFLGEVYVLVVFLLFLTITSVLCAANYCKLLITPTVSQERCIYYSLFFTKIYSRQFSFLVSQNMWNFLLCKWFYAKKCLYAFFTL